MKKSKYVAYVSTYTSKDNHGIRIYDVDLENGRFTEKSKVEITNSSYVTVSHDGKYLYAITDFGVEAYKILDDGDLEFINKSSINGMRGCYLSTDATDNFLFCAGYHDGKITVLRLNRQNGSIEGITDELFHRGLGNVAERGFRPHISSVRMTPDNEYLCAADLGIDYINVYKLDHNKGTIKPADIIRCDPGSAPRHIKFSNDGKFLYVVSELKNTVDVYSYYVENDNPFFERIQSVPTTEKYEATDVAASALVVSKDGKYILASNAGENSVVMYEINQKTGMIESLFCLPISGEYPKDIAIFPDNKHLVSLNHESNTMTFFTIDLKKKIMVMNGKEMKVERGNCVIFHELNA